MVNTENNLKDRFFRAVVLGELGSIQEVSPDTTGMVVRLKAFKHYFRDIKTQYVSSFMPAATFEPGQFTPSHTRFLFRVDKGVYLIHSDVLVAYMRSMLEAGELGEGGVSDIGAQQQGDNESSIKEAAVCYWV